jgi:hypothetical protein
VVNGKAAIVNDRPGQAYPCILIPSPPLEKVGIGDEEEQKEQDIHGAGVGFGNPSVVHHLTLVQFSVDGLHLPAKNCQLQTGHWMHDTGSKNKSETLLLSGFCGQAAE